MSLSEAEKGSENEINLVQHDQDTEESSSGEDDEQPGTSHDLPLQHERRRPSDSVPLEDAASMDQVMYVTERTESSPLAVNRVDQSFVELTSRMAEIATGPIRIHYAPVIHHHDQRQYHDNRQQHDVTIMNSKVDIPVTNARSYRQRGESTKSSFLSSPSWQRRTRGSQTVTTTDPSDVTQPKKLSESSCCTAPHAPALPTSMNESEAVNHATTSAGNALSGGDPVDDLTARPFRAFVTDNSGLTHPKEPFSSSAVNEASSSTSSTRSSNAFSRPDQYGHAHNHSSKFTTRGEPDVVILDANSKMNLETSSLGSTYRKTSFLQNMRRKLPKSKEKTAIEKVMKEQKRHLEDDIRLQGGIPVAKNIPIVHPSYTKVSFYQGGALPKEETLRPSIEEMKDIRHESSVQFRDIIRSGRRVIGVIGYPGSGKTTFSKRLARNEDYKCFHYKLMDMNYQKDLTLQQLLLEKRFPNVNRKTHEQAFKWIKNNQKKCLFIFDGLDQAGWTLKEHPTMEDYDTPRPIQDLIANLSTGHFLPDSLIVFTSRPHSVVTLPKSLRPDTTIIVGDLPYEGMKKLFHFYAGAKANELWNKLYERDLPVFRLCFNPLLLQLVIIALLNPTDSIGEITSATRAFATVFMHLQHSENTSHDITLLTEQLSILAYNASAKSTVVITPAEMRAQGLDPNEAQDIIVCLHSHCGVTSKVFEHDTKFFFAHQSYQEYFTALWIINHMPLDEFQRFVTGQMFFDDTWSVVRVFLSGLLMDVMRDHDLPVHSQAGCSRFSHTVSTSAGQSPSMVQHVDPAEKRIILTEAFELQLARFSPLTYDEWNKDDNRRKYILRLFEISECADEHLTQIAVELFPHELHLWQSPSNSFHTTLLCEVLRKQNKVIKRLDLEACFSTPGDIEKIISAITEMPGKVQILDISRNTLQTIPPSSFFMKIDQYLRMFHCFPHEDKRTGRNRNANDTERHEIQNILDQFDNSHLEVDVGGDVRLSSRNKSDLT